VTRPSLSPAQDQQLLTLADWFPRPVIDCDIHIELPSLKALYPYLPDHWCDYISESAFVGPDANDYPRGVATSVRAQWRPASGAAPGSELAMIQRDVLDPWQTEIGILTCAYWVQSVHHEDLAASLATALNQWQIEHWLEPEPRLRASLVVPSQNPALAAQEIERFGNHPGFVQVILPVRSQAPYGNRRYDPLYQAAVDHDLAVGIHYGGAPGHAPTPAGWFSTHIEEYAGMAQVFQSQVLSLIAEGVFDRFPQMRVALIEAGFTWLPGFMWRFDKEWKGLRHNTPWVKRLPSEYIHEHIRFTVQPTNAPADPVQMQQILEQFGSEDLLMFATDYPHWHFDSPAQALPVALPESTLARIAGENARTFYRL
jgi:uncharacterized protein